MWGGVCERGQRGAGNKVINRALMVFKYFSGMGLWNAGVAQTKSTWSTISSLKLSPKFHHTDSGQISEEHFML